MSKKKAAPKKAAPKKAVPKKAVKKGSVGMIKVFSSAFTAMTHNAVAGAAPRLIVECNIDGNLKNNEGNVATFTSLDDANDFAAAHRLQKGANHKCIVKASQHG